MSAQTRINILPHAFQISHPELTCTPDTHEARHAPRFHQPASEATWRRARLRFVLSACSGETQQASPGRAAPPPTVGIVVATAEPVQLTTELPGRTAAYMVAELRPQVTGIVQKRLFTEGSTVKAGQTLYQIDPATYRATFESAKASLARAEANVYSARLKAQRYADLVKIEAVSKQANDDAIAALKQAEADVASARAAVEKARIDVGFTAVTSPIAGRIGRSSVTAGALVTANQADALATVQQLDPIYETSPSRAPNCCASSAISPKASCNASPAKAVPVRLVLEDGSEYASEGRLEFSEVSVDSDTGSVTLRAVFPNPSARCCPACMYVPSSPRARSRTESWYRTPR